jgi:hypothetical protein
MDRTTAESMNDTTNMDSKTAESMKHGQYNSRVFE